MQKITLAKTVLAILPQIDKYCEYVAKTNHLYALQSFYLEHQDTEKYMQRIIDRSHKSQTLRNLKVRVERLLNTAVPETKKVLELSFIKGKKIALVAKGLDKSERTVFRVMEKAIEWFADGLPSIGVNSRSFQELLEDYTWIRTEFENQLRTESFPLSLCIGEHVRF